MTKVQAGELKVLQQKAGNSEITGCMLKSYS